MVLNQPMSTENPCSALTSWATSPVQSHGVIVGCSRSHEWLLPWWWMHFQTHNIQIPVTFFDFGDMTTQGQQWCRTRGQLQMLPSSEITCLIKAEDNIHPQQASEWKKHKNIDVWKMRLAWFQKPFACLHSPYEKTLWIDLDCQVRKSLTPLFSFCDNACGLSLSKEPDYVMEEHRESGELLPGEIEYNSGVIAFKHGSPIIQKWAQKCLEDNGGLRGDQEVMSRLLFERKIKIMELPYRYVQRGEFSPKTQQVSPIDESNIVLHWCGSHKCFIKVELDFLTNKVFMDLSLG